MSCGRHHLVTGPPQFKNRLLPLWHAISGKIMQAFRCNRKFDPTAVSGRNNGDGDGEIAMKKFLLGTVGLLALGMGPALAADMAVKARRPRLWPRFTVGPASTSAATVVGVRATSAGMSIISVHPSPLSVKVVTMRTAERLVVKSDIAGRPPIGCSVWKRRATGPTSTDPMLVFSFPVGPTIPRSKRSACSPVRSVMPGTTCFGM